MWSCVAAFVPVVQHLPANTADIKGFKTKLALSVQWH